MTEDDEAICGEAWDHDIVITYEDPYAWQGYCRICGAEFDEEYE